MIEIDPADRLYTLFHNNAYFCYREKGDKVECLGSFFAVISEPERVQVEKNGKKMEYTTGGRKIILVNRLVGNQGNVLFIKSVN
jgi:hypothetical protein